MMKMMNETAEAEAEADLKDFQYVIDDNRERDKIELELRELANEYDNSTKMVETEQQLLDIYDNTLSIKELREVYRLANDGEFLTIKEITDQVNKYYDKKKIPKHIQTEQYSKAGLLRDVISQEDEDELRPLIKVKIVDHVDNEEIERMVDADMSTSAMMNKIYNTPQHVYNVDSDLLLRHQYRKKYGKEVFPELITKEERKAIDKELYDNRDKINAIKNNTLHEYNRKQELDSENERFDTKPADVVEGFDIFYYIKEFLSMEWLVSAIKYIFQWPITLINLLFQQIIYPITNEMDSIASESMGRNVTVFTDMAVLIPRVITMFIHWVELILEVAIKIMGQILVFVLLVAKTIIWAFSGISNYGQYMMNLFIFYFIYLANTGSPFANVLLMAYKMTEFCQDWTRMKRALIVAKNILILPLVVMSFIVSYAWTLNAYSKLVTKADSVQENMDKIISSSAALNRAKMVSTITGVPLTSGDESRILMKEMTDKLDAAKKGVAYNTKNYPDESLKQVLQSTMKSLQEGNGARNMKSKMKRVKVSLDSQLKDFKSMYKKHVNRDATAFRDFADDEIKVFGKYEKNLFADSNTDLSNYAMYGV